MSHSEEKCNICDCPRTVTFQERDEDSGNYHTQTHTVSCGGHQAIHPALWNRSKEYDTYRKFSVRQFERTNKPPRPRNSRGFLISSKT